MLSFNWITIFLFSYLLNSAAFGLGSIQEKTQKLAYSSAWLNLYQYELKSKNQYRSDNNSPYFFFAKNGISDPLAELNAAIDSFMNPTKKIGVQKSFASCVYPARKIIIEKALKIEFPAVECPDLKRWVSSIDANRVSIIFAGAYSNNPASLLGHTILRFFNHKKENKQAGLNLLSYAVGFLASTDPRDNRFEYMVNGISGGYDGLYNIEPFYMKVGLYNNSESRDLWEQELNFNEEEVNLLVLHLWEVVHNASIPYYFIDENCSYRLLTLLEAARPTLNASKESSWPVLPADTVKLLAGGNALAKKQNFRPSINRRKNQKLLKLTDEQLEQFNSGIKDKQKLEKIKDFKVLDALIDHWTYKNYKERTKLNPSDKEIMEKTFSLRAELKNKSPEPISGKEYRRMYNLFPPYEGHKSSWYGIQGGKNSHSQNLAGITYRLGAHAPWQPKKGYDNFAAIEYLGFDLLYDLTNNKISKWLVQVAKVKSLEAFNSPTPSMSWYFDINLSNQCQICKKNVDNLKMEAGAGVNFSFINSDIIVYLLPGIESNVFPSDKPYGILAPKLKSGLKLNLNDTILLLESDKAWWKKEIYSITSLTINYSFSLDRSVNLTGEFYDLPGKSSQMLLAYLVNF